MTPKENCNWGSRNERFTKALSKRVQAFDKEGNLVYDFPSTMEAQRQMGFSNSAICACCNGKRKSAYGLIWKYVE